MSETPIEEPVEDWAEQQREVTPDEPARGRLDDLGPEVDPADAAEQGDEVPLDEDEWR